MNNKLIIRKKNIIVVGSLALLCLFGCTNNDTRSVGRVKLEREIVYDSISDFSFIETMTEDSLYGIESMSGKTIIPPVYHEVWLDNHEYKATISPSFFCVKRNEPNNIYALFDTMGNVIIPIDKGYNYIVPKDNFIQCGYYKGKRWYQKNGNETDFYNVAIYDGTGMLKIDTTEGFDNFWNARILEIEMEKDKPLKQNYIISNYLVGWRPIVYGSVIIGRKYVYYDLSTWDSVFTECDGSLNGSEWTCGSELICKNGFFNFSDGQYICVYNKNRECVIPFDRHYKTVYNVKQGIYSYFVVGYDDDCWGLCDKYGTEIVHPSHKYKNYRGICYVNGNGFRYCSDYDAHFLSDSEIWESTESMNVYLDELSVGHTF